ncbi:MAG: glycosidase [Thermoprotei archaeon]
MARYPIKFTPLPGALEASSKRVPYTSDIVVRSGVISPDKVLLHNYPLNNPVAVFNPSAYSVDEYLKIYARIILGYYMYVSSIIEISIPWEDILYGYIDMNSYPGDIVVYPTNKWDVWGTEDPRVNLIDGKVYMTYTGRSINYFNPVVRKNRTLPITAVYDENEKRWVKKYVFIPEPKVFGEVVSDKDAFLYKVGDEIYLFHRPHLADDTFHLVISRVKLREEDRLAEIIVDNAYTVLATPDFESKIGWAAPPIPINSSGDRVVVLIHGVDRDVVVYRVFAIELVLKKGDLAVTAVTPNYIMEPRAPYEVIGDRPLTVFPCGAVPFNREHILVTYGAGDYMVGLGIIELNTLLSELDKGRIY